MKIIQRTKSGEDEYNRSVWTEEEKEVIGRFQVLDAPDQPVEEGGVKSIRQARIFLPLPGGFIDEYDRGTPGSPEKIDSTGIWEQLVFDYVETDGTYLFVYVVIEPRQFGGCETVLRYPWDRLESTMGHVQPTPLWSVSGGPSDVIGPEFFARNPDEDAGITIFWIEAGTGSAPYIATTTSYQGSQENLFTTNIPGGLIDDSRFIIRRVPGAIEFEFPDYSPPIMHRHEIVVIPRTVPLTLGYFGANFRSEYVRTEERDTLREFTVEDEFEARGQRWAQIEKPLFTHLQSEFTVQEVKP